MPELLIRDFQPHDQTAARALILAGLGEHFGFIDETLNPDVDDIAAHYVDKGHAFVVVEAAGVLIGTGALIIDPGRTGQMVRVSVHADYRRRGIGQQIVRHLMQVGAARGLESIWIETTTGWQDAIGLYESLGFRVYEADADSTYLRRALA